MAEVATAPDGRQWVVRREWIPLLKGESPWRRFRRRIRSTRDRVGDAADVPDFDIGEGIIAAILVVVAVLVLLVLILPLLVAIVEIVLLLLLAALAIIASTALGRPWTVSASADDGSYLTWKVKGWRPSGRRCEEIAQSLTSGLTPPPDPPG